MRSLRGQPVVLLVADSPETKSFRKQLKILRGGYSQFASRQAIFVAAFRKGDTGPVQSNVPFVVANNGAAVASAYAVDGDFQLIVIGKDGNVDYETWKLVPVQRISDVMSNNFQVQAESRKQQQ